MINQNDIFTALQNGEDPEVIANSFTDALNAAIKQKAEADEAAKVKQKAENARQEKLDFAAGIIEDIMDFLEEFYPDVYDEDMREAATSHPELLVNAFDQAEAEIKRMKPLFDELERLAKALDEDKDLKPTSIPTPTRNPIEDFLKMNGLKN